MARILLTGNFSHKSLGKNSYSVDRKLCNGFIRAGHHVWDFSDRDISRASNPFGSRKMGIGATNRKFLEAVANHAPDLILLGHADIIHTRTLVEAKKLYPHVKISVFNIDPLFTRNNVLALNDRVDVVDTMFITTAGDLLRQFKRPHNKIGYFPNPSDEGIENGKAYEQQNQPNDVFFCIGGAAPGDVRLEIAKYVQDNLPQVKCDYYGMFGKKNLWGKEYQSIMCSAKMALNISRKNDVYLYSSDRMSHVMGNGLLTFIDGACGFQKFFSDRELVFYKDPADLCRKIAHYKANDNERRAIAKAGSEKYHALFNSTLVAQYIYEVTMGLRFSHNYAWADEIVA